MADENVIMSVISTTGSRVNDLLVKNGQLIFINDRRSLALDFEGKRVYYKQIVTLQKDNDRQSILAPIEEVLYFVAETSSMWIYCSANWVKLTYTTREIADAITPLINNKADKVHAHTAEQVAFEDGQTFQQKYDSGELNGKDGVATQQTYVGDTEPEDENITVWIDTDGEVGISANELTFGDGKSLQQKYDSGELNGRDGHSPIRGVDYWTDADKAEIVAATIAALPVYDGEVL